ncbi:hypothetical protein PY254_04610 [Rhodanobacter sp. AS-Z3]|uniref:hypothetical protein n=1 Tax=Rhodanobacter sp. AS-Z3 TaxID=3031330 RepID=UPI0024793995|nr:hypothetical protein [Rhodanobacter sp. AS-Z3]WEN15958.1 hypothetical protein PY254_04610 [Rhodanobacter sp. AS-Z3]
MQQLSSTSTRFNQRKIQVLCSGSPAPFVVSGLSGRLDAESFRSSSTLFTSVPRTRELIERFDAAWQPVR